MFSVPTVFQHQKRYSSTYSDIATVVILRFHKSLIWFPLFYSGIDRSGKINCFRESLSPISFLTSDTNFVSFFCVVCFIAHKVCRYLFLLHFSRVLAFESLWELDNPRLWLIIWRSVMSVSRYVQYNSPTRFLAQVVSTQSTAELGQLRYHSQREDMCEVVLRKSSVVLYLTRLNQCTVEFPAPFLKRLFAPVLNILNKIPSSNRHGENFRLNGNRWIVVANFYVIT